MSANKQLKLMTIVEGDCLLLVNLYPDGAMETVYQASLDTLMSRETSKPVIPSKVLANHNALLVFPDYWLGITAYPFSARKRSLIAPFVERKLFSDIPGFDEINDFYGYTPYKISNREQMLHVYFLQDSAAYSLYHKLAAMGISPTRMTTPALLWQHKLTGLYGEAFADGGKGLLHVEQDNFHLYFFFKGQFLFSRRIAIPDSQMTSEDKVGLLNYELNQSFYLFSQKSKDRVDNIYIVSSDPDIVEPLGDALSIPLTICENDKNGIPSDTECKGSGTVLPSVLQPILQRDFSTDAPFQSITHKPLARKLEWHPIQNMGIAVGVVLLLCLAFETLVLKSWSDNGPVLHAATHWEFQEHPKQILGKYSQALDMVIEKQNETDPAGTIADLCHSVPREMAIQKVRLASNAPASIHVEASVSAKDPAGFKQILSRFLNDFNSRFELTSPLRETDIRVRKDREASDHGRYAYVVEFSTELQ